MEFKAPEKWRETINPFSLNLKRYKIDEVIGYPHARNEVFLTRGFYDGKEVYAFLKYAHTKESDFKLEVDIINKIKLPFIPKILEYDCDKYKYIVTQAIEGNRLSEIVGENKNMQSLDYMQEYGKILALFHSLNIDCKRVKDRKFFHVPTEDYLKENDLLFIKNFLVQYKPQKVNYCFCHGDLHYANVLWKNKKVSAVLDFELSGIGNKEFDIAWSIIRRPSQKFMKTQKEVDEFLKGYKTLGTCNEDYIKYYEVLIYAHFYSVENNNQEYKKFVREMLKKLVK